MQVHLYSAQTYSMCDHMIYWDDVINLNFRPRVQKPELVGRPQTNN